MRLCRARRRMRRRDARRQSPEQSDRRDRDGGYPADGDEARPRHHADGRTRRSAWLSQQTERHFPRSDAEARTGGADRGCNRAPARLRDDGTLGSAAADRRLRAAGRAERSGRVQARLFRLALQGVAVAQRSRTSALRCLAQKLRDDPSRRRRVRRRTVEQPVECAEIGPGDARRRRERHRRAAARRGR